MARLTEHGLRRSVGVSGLLATAYGNVGSSIYYALGLVAAHALGLTPVVFMLAGGLFVPTAKTYAEGAAMYPEAGEPRRSRATPSTRRPRSSPAGP
jgi:APA family basic amino acid/polyamine antiporter